MESGRAQSKGVLSLWPVDFRLRASFDYSRIKRSFRSGCVYVLSTSRLPKFRDRLIMKRLVTLSAASPDGIGTSEVEGCAGSAL